MFDKYLLLWEKKEKIIKSFKPQMVHLVFILRFYSEIYSFIFKMHAFVYFYCNQNVGFVVF